MSNIIGLNFENWVTEEIEQRQKLNQTSLESNYSPTQLSYLNQKGAFVRVISSVNVDDSKVLRGLPSSFSNYKGNQLAAEYTLQGGIRNINTQNLRSGVLGAVDKSTEAYGLGNESGMGLQPMPGITDFSVKSLNRGSLKESTIKIKAYNRVQFEIISLLYLRLGFTLFIEWGHNIIVDNKNGEITQNAFTCKDTALKTSEPKKILNKILEQRKASNGNYDGLLGKIKNFSWSINKSGHYDIDVTLLSLGDVIETIKVNTNYFNGNVKIDGLTLPDNQAIVDAAEEIRSDQKEARKEAYSEGDIVEADDLDDSEIVFSQRFANDISFYLYKVSIGKALNTNLSSVRRANAILGNSGDTDGNEFSSDSQSRAVVEKLLKVLESASINFGDEDDKNFCYIDFEGGENIYGYYIRLGWLLEYIEKNILMTISNTDDSSRSPYVEIDYDSKTNICFSCKGQISVDPRVCIIGNKTVKLDGEDQFLYEGTASYYTNPKEGQEYGQLMNVYVSILHVIKVLKQLQESTAEETPDVSLLDFLKQIMSDIQTSTGNVNQFDVVYDSDENKVKIIDQTSIRNIQQIASDLGLEKGNKVASFNIYGFNESGGSFVRDFTFKTEITNKLATTIAIGAGGGKVGSENASGLSNLNSGLINRHINKIKPPEGVEEVEDNGEPTSVEVKYQNQLETLGEFVESQIDSNKGKGFFGGLLNLFADDQTEWDEDLFDSCKPILNNVLSYQIQQATELLNEKNKLYNNVSPLSGFIPLNANFTFDGLSGIKIYERFVLSQNILPDNYSKGVDYLIKGINHKIGSDNQWVTSIETIGKPSEESLNNVGSSDSLNILKGKNSNIIQDRFNNRDLTKKLGEEEKLNEPGNIQSTTLPPFSGNTAVYNPSTQRGRTYPSGIEYKLSLINRGNAKIKRVFIHHTAGWDDRAGIIKGWEKRVTTKGNKGVVSTEYIVSMKNPDKQGKLYAKLWEQLYDGQKYWAYANSTGNKGKEEVGIELTALGWLNKRSDGSFYQDKIKKDSNTGKDWVLDKNVGIVHEINSDGKVVESKKWQNKKYFHKYTNDQIASLEEVLLRIATYPNFEGTYKFGYEEYKDMFPSNFKNSTLTPAYKNNPNQMFCHSSTTNKTDCYPQKELLEMLIGLENKRVGKLIDTKPSNVALFPNVLSREIGRYINPTDIDFGALPNEEVQTELRNVLSRLLVWFKNTYPDTKEGNAKFLEYIKLYNKPGKLSYEPVILHLVFNTIQNGNIPKDAKGNPIRLSPDYIDSAFADAIEARTTKRWKEVGNPEISFDSNV